MFILETRLNAQNTEFASNRDWMLQLVTELEEREENRLPCITMVESAGANLLYAAEIFADVGGKVFANQARMSAQGIPLNKGDALLKLEAMKMEHTIRSAADGVLEAIYFAPGETVAADTLLVQLKEVE